MFYLSVRGYESDINCFHLSKHIGMYEYFFCEWLCFQQQVYQQKLFE